jgi:putative ABC transport system permease protein
MNIQFTLASRYLRGRKLRTFLTTLAVMFGVLVIFMMNLLVPTMIKAFQSNMLAASAQVDMTISLRSGESFSPEALEQVKAVDGVNVAHGFLGRALNLPADFYDNDPQKADQVSTISLIGLDVDRAQTVRSYPLDAGQGRFLTPNDTNAVVIAASLADMLNLKVGDALPLPTAQGLVHLTVVGIRPARTQPGNEELLVTLPEAQLLFNEPDRINTIEANYNTTDKTRRKEIEQAVQARLGDNYAFGTLSSGSDIFSTIQTVQVGMNAFGFLALFMGAFIIFNTFRTIVAERRRDIGMLRAVGASRRMIVGIILTESLVQGAIGTLLGMALGYLLAATALGGLTPMMQQIIHINFGWPIITPGLVIITVALGLGVTIIAGLLPAISAGRVTPLEALRPSVAGVSYRRMISASAILGIILLVVALLVLFTHNVGLLALGALLFLFGLILIAPALVRPLSLVFGKLLALVYARQGTGILAQSNLARQPSRAAVTASTTMIAMAIIVALGGMSTSIQQGFLGILKRSLGSDYLLVPPAISVWQNNVGANASLVERLREIKGVGPVSTFRHATTIADVTPVLSKGTSSKSGITISLLGIDPVTFPQVSGLRFDSGNPDTAYADLGAARTIIANPVLAAAGGFKVGDLVPLITPEGTLEYRVVAVAGDFLNIKVNTAYISQVNMAADFHKTDDIFIQLNLTPDANRAEVASAMRVIRQDFPQFTLVEGDAYYQQMSSLFSLAFSAIFVMYLFLAVPSLVAMLNTLAISVIERTREIGMLRAVGATRGQVSRMILAEALLMAAFGTTFGLLAGLYLGYLLVGAMDVVGFSLGYSFPVEGIVAALVIGLLFGALAAVIPSRQAARMEIVQALRYE